MMPRKNPKSAKWFTPPVPQPGCFPRSWKTWRKLRGGESFKKDDRVLWESGKTSMSMGILAGEKAGDNHIGAYPAGWYYRKTS